jgi:uncharacterized protein YciI
VYLLISRYLKPLDEVDASLADHRAYLKRFYDEGLFLVSGPRVPRTGGVIVAKLASRSQAEEFLRNDPFVQRGIAAYEIIEFTPANSAAAIAAFLG